jgi:hypothetical protein
MQLETLQTPIVNYYNNVNYYLRVGRIDGDCHARRQIAPLVRPLFS